MMLKYLLPVMFCASAALADAPRVVGVEAEQRISGWSFAVSVAHADSGWEHYADGWEVSLHDGTVLGHRVLAHPHVNEQPFTRSLSGIAIPADVTSVQVRAHDLVHGWGAPVTVTLSR